MHAVSFPVGGMVYAEKNWAARKIIIVYPYENKQYTKERKKNALDIVFYNFFSLMTS